MEFRRMRFLTIKSLMTQSTKKGKFKSSLTSNQMIQNLSSQKEKSARNLSVKSTLQADPEDQTYLKV